MTVGSVTAEIARRICEEQPVGYSLHFTESPDDLSGDAVDGHAKPPCCPSQPAPKLNGPALHPTLIHLRRWRQHAV